MGELDQFYQFEQVKLEIKDFKADGFILDIGGGGEGVIGRLKGIQVIAIDIIKNELLEAADGPFKILMDARDLSFLEASFNTATAFFSLMYIKTKEDQQKIFNEVGRVLKPGGTFHVWDVDLAERPESDKEVYIAFIHYRVKEYEIGTGYGQRWPEEPRGESDYIRMAEAAGLQLLHKERNKHTFYMVFQKVG